MLKIIKKNIKVFIWFFLIIFFIIVLSTILILSFYFNIKSYNKNKINTKSKYISLTFDDGVQNYSNLENIINTFNKYSIKTTFFVNGGNLRLFWKQSQKNKELIFKLIDTGHSFGNHSWFHIKYINLNKLYNDITKTSSLIFKIYNERIDYLNKNSKNTLKLEKIELWDIPIRSPYLQSAYSKNLKTKRVWRNLIPKLEKEFFKKTIKNFYYINGYLNDDWNGKTTANQIFENSIKLIKPGYIIVAHENTGTKDKTIDWLEKFIIEVTKKGFKFFHFTKNLKNYYKKI